ncbi:glutathione S-transferase domain-containing protein [Gonapodya prolifera JEL478]|uniref:Glutathione S-transferase domain-containing protein n=1 Tax=Gonapodya prolifera (strain JEL478) TaxID=1344416 RepID=A0A138ZZN5_GONPJ|nr:glutathione S-transferase domain-containing protein [Gonapodya prolifera JEL478]|eukprot:KXS09960.1 glutathione S-transferase domain-containing protein [Gonapodya prolifera JEL478]
MNGDRASTSTSPIHLYSRPSPNGQKIHIAVEEFGLPYEAHMVDIINGEQRTPAFTAISPNQKIPAIVDPDADPACDGGSINLFESGAILLYFAEKTGKFIPQDFKGRWDVIQWLFWQMAGVGPAFGHFGYFAKFAPVKNEPAIAIYAAEVTRLLGVLETRLQGPGREYIVGNEFTIADMATLPWVDALLDDQALVKQYFSGVALTNVIKWSERCNARPGVQRGKKVMVNDGK